MFNGLLKSLCLSVANRQFGSRRRRRYQQFSDMEVLEDRRMLAASGLQGQYFNDAALTSLADTRIDRVVEFRSDWGAAPLGTALTPDDTYSARWTGYVKIDQPGEWEFSTTSNDGVRLWVDDQSVIENWNQHSVAEDNGSLTLGAGWYPIRLEYFQQGGAAEITLSFSGPGKSQTIIPATHLSTDPGQSETIDFSDHEIGSYGGNAQNAPDSEGLIEDDGATIHLVGNGWKQIEFPYNVTPETVLEFDFRSPTEGEISAIGFDDDLALTTESFKLYGSQNWGVTDFADYEDFAPGWRHYEIPVGEFFTGDFSYLYFANDDDAEVGAESFFRNVTVYEARQPEAIDFRDYQVGLFGGRGQNTDDSEGLIEDNGATIHLVGNGWKQIEFPYNVTPETVLEFDFRSPNVGEISGIGFDYDLALTELTPGFRLYGSQNWGITDFADYEDFAPEWRHYRIPAGEFFIGDFSYLYFANDDDAEIGAESYFRNVTVYEAESDGGVLTANDDSFSILEDENATLNVLANSAATVVKR